MIASFGAHMKGQTNLHVATDILLKYCLPRGLMGVIFYDDDLNLPRVLVLDENDVAYQKCSKTSSSTETSRKTVVKTLKSTKPAELKSVTKVDLNMLFVFCDHRHITGIDIPLHYSTRALITWSIDTSLRDVLQGIMRMRNFLSTQSVTTVVLNSFERVLSSQRNLHQTKVRDAGGKGKCSRERFCSCR